MNIVRYYPETLFEEDLTKIKMLIKKSIPLNNKI